MRVPTDPDAGMGGPRGGMPGPRGAMPWMAGGAGLEGEFEMEGGFLQPRRRASPTVLLRGPARAARRPPATTTTAPTTDRPPTRAPSAAMTTTTPRWISAAEVARASAPPRGQGRDRVGARAGDSGRGGVAGAGAGACGGGVGGAEMVGVGVPNAGAVPGVVPEVSRGAAKARRDVGRRGRCAHNDAGGSGGNAACEGEEG
mmetsp:Transcript_18515/g.46481  ORF Transcript_18515/g.46481 Transcript_18515/m.46481 type:complete len:201 (-) Transcript_18515:481-1083(-)